MSTGTEYHTYPNGELILDENNKPIPKSICLCHAFEPNECICGAWDDVTDWYDNE